jgi:hypothetical protein
VGLFHPDAAEEHRAAYDRPRLQKLLATHGFSVLLYRPFELGANQLVVGRRADRPVTMRNTDREASLGHTRGAALSGRGNPPVSSTPRPTSW